MSAAAVTAANAVHSETFDRPIPRTSLEVFQSLPEGTLAELIDNIIYVAPAPELPHQRTVVKLTSLLYNFIEQTGKGEVFVAPIDVYLDGAVQCVQPDLAVVLKEQAHLLADGKKIRGAPAILIEILSTNRNHDLIKKRELYARYGVQEYFVIDPETKAVMHFVLRGAAYELDREETGVLYSGLLNTHLTW